MELHVRYEGDDDPAKCTARALDRADEVTLHRQPGAVPHGIVLDPHAERALSPADDHDRLIALDCSWETAEREAYDLPGDRRALPFLVAANPVNFGTAFELTTVEALAGSLAILGDHEHARRLLHAVGWDETFLELNDEPLRRYAECQDSSEVVAVQEEYLG